MSIGVPKLDYFLNPCFLSMNVKFHPPPPGEYSVSPHTQGTPQARDMDGAICWREYWENIELSGG